MKFGYDVIIYEVFYEFGGVLMYGIFEFRFLKEIVNKEIEKFRKFGVKIFIDYVVGRIVIIEEFF